MGLFNLKCESCGAELVAPKDGVTIECEYCHRKYLWKEPKSDKLVSDLARANNYRLANRFADAIMEYKLILEEKPADAEAHWGKVLSTYGIEYVKDPRTERYIPTCHRAVRESVLENANYKQALVNATKEQGAEYTALAKEIARLQKNILRLVDESEDFDVFISFKSTDSQGRITKDAQIARIIYDELTNRGIKTFFSDVTLENMLFSDYEPVIFRALFSCKYFVLVGTSEENINAPWVKNEWSRFEERMENEKLSGVACAVFDGALVKELPSFVRAQGVDLRRYAAGGYEKHIADAVEKKLGRKKKSKEEEAILKQIEEQKRAQRELEERLKGIQAGGAGAPVSTAAPSVQSLLKRARQELEANNKNGAKEYYQKVLDIDPENAMGWYGLLIIEFGFNGFLFEDSKIIYNYNEQTVQKLVQSATFRNACQYADSQTRGYLTKDIKAIIRMLEGLAERRQKEIAEVQAKISEENDKKKKVEQEKSAVEKQRAAQETRKKTGISKIKDGMPVATVKKIAQGIFAGILIAMILLCGLLFFRGEEEDWISVLFGGGVLGTIAGAVVAVVVYGILKKKSRVDSEKYKQFKDMLFAFDNQIADLELNIANINDGIEKCNREIDSKIELINSYKQCQTHFEQLFDSLK